MESLQNLIKFLRWFGLFVNKSHFERRFLPTVSKVFLAATFARHYFPPEIRSFSVLKIINSCNVLLVSLSNFFFLFISQLYFTIL